MDSNDLRSSDDICYVDLLVALIWLGRTRGYCVEFVSIKRSLHGEFGPFSFCNGKNVTERGPFCLFRACPSNVPQLPLGRSLIRKDIDTDVANDFVILKFASSLFSLHFSLNLYDDLMVHELSNANAAEFFMIMWRLRW